MRWYVMIKIKVLCPRSGSHRKVKQNDNLCPVQDWFHGFAQGHSQGSKVSLKGFRGICYIL